MKNWLWFVVLFTPTIYPAKHPLTSPQPYKSQGLLSGGDTRHLNLDRLELEQKGNGEHLDIYFSVGSRRIAIHRLPPYQLRYESKAPGREFDRLILTLQGLSARFVSRLALQKVSNQSNLIESLHLHPPLEDGDTALEIILNKPCEFKTDPQRSVDLRLSLRPIPDTPLLP